MYLEEATFHISTNYFINPHGRQYPHLYKFLLLISTYNKNTQENCCISCVLRPQFWNENYERYDYNLYPRNEHNRSMLRAIPFIMQFNVAFHQKAHPHKISKTSRKKNRGLDVLCIPSIIFSNSHAVGMSIKLWLVSLHNKMLGI